MIGETVTDFRGLWDRALRFDAFVAASAEHGALWSAVHRLARLPDWAAAAATAAPRRRFLVLAEDWCGDASNTIPVLDRWAALGEGLELRILRRDEHPAVMDRYLTNGSRSIPIVIALDEGFAEVGHWGPRPAPLQAWVMAHRGTMPKDELYPRIRAWYARDRGETTLREVAAAAGIALPEREKVA